MRRPFDLGPLVPEQLEGRLVRHDVGGRLPVWSGDGTSITGDFRNEDLALVVGTDGWRGDFVRILTTSGVDGWVHFELLRPVDDDT